MCRRAAPPSTAVEGKAYGCARWARTAAVISSAGETLRRAKVKSDELLASLDEDRAARFIESRR